MVRNFQPFYKNKRVLVTGHTGFKGSWLCEWLLSMGAQVSGLSLDVPTQPSLFECLRLNERLTSFETDIGDFESLKRIFQKGDPEILFHLAAQPLVRESYESPLKTFQTNVMGTLHVLEACRELKGLRSAVIVTSDKVYENGNGFFAFRESDPLGGKDPYSASKACAELATASYIQSFFSNSVTRIARARAGNVIGGGDWAKDRIIPDCVRAWSKNKPVELRSPNSVRPWQHVLEPIGGYLLLANALFEDPKRIHGDAFNFGPDISSSLTVEGIVKKCSQYWPGITWSSLVKPQNEEKPEATFLQVNCDKAYHLLGWRPSLSLEETVEWTMDWYRNHLANPNKIAESTQKQIGAYQERLFEVSRY